MPTEPKSAALFALITMAAVQICQFAAAAESFLYWSAFETGIWRGELSTEGLKNPANIVPFSHPYRLDVDPIGRKVYWAGGYDSPKIFRANLDGSNVEPFFENLKMTFPFGLDIDGARAYWTDHDTADVWSASLDGKSSARTEFPNLSNLHDIEVGDGRWYFEAQDPGEILFGPKDNPSADTFPAFEVAMSGPHGIAVDEGERVVVWTDQVFHGGSAIYVSPLPNPVSGYIDGDANKDRRIGLDDFGSLKAMFGIGKEWEAGDFNNDENVDLTDFGLLKKNFAGPRSINDPFLENAGPVALDLMGLAGPAGSIYWGQPSGIFRATPSTDQFGVVGYTATQLSDMPDIQGLAVVSIPDDSGLTAVVPEPGCLLLIACGAVVLLFQMGTRRSVS